MSSDHVTSCPSVSVQGPSCPSHCCGPWTCTAECTASPQPGSAGSVLTTYCWSWSELPQGRTAAGASAVTTMFTSTSCPVRRPSATERRLTKTRSVWTNEILRRAMCHHLLKCRVCVFPEVEPSGRLHWHTAAHRPLAVEWRDRPESSASPQLPVALQQLGVGGRLVCGSELRWRTQSDWGKYTFLYSSITLEVRYKPVDQVCVVRAGSMP